MDPLASRIASGADAEIRRADPISES